MGESHTNGGFSEESVEVRVVGLKCSYCKEPMVGKGVVAHFDAEDFNPAKLGWQYLEVTTPDGSEQVAFPLHPVHWDEIMKELYQQEKGIIVSLFVADVEDLIAGMGIE